VEEQNGSGNPQAEARDLEARIAENVAKLLEGE
jgi:hypothetical protein